MAQGYAARVSKVHLFFAYLRYLVWFLFTKIFLGFMYVQVISEGLRMLVPPLGQKLHRMPGLAALAHFEETHKLDLAPLFAVFLVIAVFYLWSRIIRSWLQSDPDEPLDWFVDRESTIVSALGLVILTADGILFYVAMLEFTWGSVFSLTALIATVAYIAVVIFVTYVSVNLYNDINSIKKGQR